MSVRPVSALERLDAILANPATYELAAVTPEPDYSHGGRRRQFPTFVFIVFEALLSVFPDGRRATLRLYARDGAIGIGTLTDKGDLHFTPLERVRTHRNRDQCGKYRWYNDYQLPKNLGGGTITVRLHSTDEDARRKFNRTET